MKISAIRARILGALAMAALLVLVVGSPAALVAWGHLDASTVLHPARWLAPDDGSILLTVVTVSGWVAWTVFSVCVVAEAVGVVTSQRYHVKLPGLSAVQGIAAGLLVASLTVLSPLTRSAVPSVPVSDAAAAVATPQPASEIQASSAEHDEGVTTVTVGPHDDLWALAETWYGDGTSWRRIAAANPDVDVDHLVFGQRLALPGATVTVPAGHTGAGRPIDAEELNQIAPQSEASKARTVTVEQGWELVLPDSAAEDKQASDQHTDETAGARVKPVSAGTLTGNELLPEVGDDTTATVTEATAGPPVAAGVDEVASMAEVGQNPAEILRAGLAGLSLFLAGEVAGTVTARRRQQLFTRPLGRRIPTVSGEPRRAKRVLDAAVDQLDESPQWTPLLSPTP